MKQYFYLALFILGGNVVTYDTSSTLGARYVVLVKNISVSRSLSNILVSVFLTNWRSRLSLEFDVLDCDFLWTYLRHVNHDLDFWPQNTNMYYTCCEQFVTKFVVFM